MTAGELLLVIVGVVVVALVLKRPSRWPSPPSRRPLRGMK